jgi:hypothetical protein
VQRLARRERAACEPAEPAHRGASLLPARQQAALPRGSPCRPSGGDWNTPCSVASPPVRTPGLRGACARPVTALSARRR